MLYAVVGFLPCFVKPLFVGFLHAISMEGMGWVFEISDIRLLTWFFGIWQVFLCYRDCGLQQGLP
jgi:hypothetical protein